MGGRVGLVALWRGEVRIAAFEERGGLGFVVSHPSQKISKNRFFDSLRSLRMMGHPKL
jgi:hypothetical protein